MRHQRVVIEDRIHHAQPLGLDAVEAAGGVQQIGRPGGSDQPRQQPAHALFGRHAQAREGRVEQGRTRGKADVAMQRKNETPAEGRSVDRRDRRLARGDQRVPAAAVIALQAGADVVAPLRRGRQFGRFAAIAGAAGADDRQIHPRRKSPARAGHHDHPYVGIGGRADHRVKELLEHRRGERIELVGSIEGQRRDTCLERIQDR